MSAVPSYQSIYSPRNRNLHKHHHGQSPDTTLTAPRLSQNNQSPTKSFSFSCIKSHKPSSPRPLTVMHHASPHPQIPKVSQRTPCRQCAYNIMHRASRFLQGVVWPGRAVYACCARLAPPGWSTRGYLWTGVAGRVCGGCDGGAHLPAWRGGWWVVMRRTERVKGICVLSLLLLPVLVPVLTPPLARPGPGGIGRRCRQHVTAGDRMSLLGDGRGSREQCAEVRDRANRSVPSCVIFDKVGAAHEVRARQWL